MVYPETRGSSDSGPLGCVGVLVLCVALVSLLYYCQPPGVVAPEEERACADR